MEEEGLLRKQFVIWQQQEIPFGKLISQSKLCVSVLARD